MSPEQICKEYREAKNKKQQIGILADQNLCGKSEIIKILIEAGEDMSCMEPKKGKGKPKEAPKEPLPEAVLGVLYARLDLIDQEMAAKEEEYKQIVNFIKNYNRQQEQEQ